VYQAHILKKMNDWLLPPIAESGVNIDSMPVSSEFTGEFPDVNAHAAGIIGTQLPNGVGMDAEHCYSKLFKFHFNVPTVSIDNANFKLMLGQLDQASV
jgi:hypothetical protein